MKHVLTTLTKIYQIRIKSQEEMDEKSMILFRPFSTEDELLVWNSLCGGNRSGFGGETSCLLRPLALVLGADLLPVHAVLTRVAMSLGLLDSITVVLPVLIVMRII